MEISKKHHPANNYLRNWSYELLWYCLRYGSRRVWLWLQQFNIWLRVNGVIRIFKYFYPLSKTSRLIIYPEEKELLCFT